jgi:RNA polymerase sigma factor (TIGR02999 family)
VSSGEQHTAHITRLLQAVERGDRQAAGDLLPLVYEELRDLASAKLSKERAGQTLQATALVHEAYLRLIGSQDAPKWDSRGHFFAAAALAMRRILVERARHRKRLKHGGGGQRVDLDPDMVGEKDDRVDLIALDEALDRLEKHDARKAQVVMLRYFTGLSIEETAAAMELSPATVKTEWAFARAWLHRELAGSSGINPRGQP